MKKKSEDEQPLEKKIEEDEKLIKQLQEKKIKRKALAEKNTALKRHLKCVVSLGQRLLKRNCGNSLTH